MVIQKFSLHLKSFQMHPCHPVLWLAIVSIGKAELPAGGSFDLFRRCQGTQTITVLVAEAHGRSGGYLTSMSDELNGTVDKYMNILSKGIVIIG